MLLYKLSSNAQWLGSIIVLIVCVICYRQRPAYIKVLVFYALTSIIFQTILRIIRVFFQNRGLNEAGDIYVLFEGVILPLVFYHAVQNKVYRKGVVAGILIYILVYCFAFHFYQPYFYSIIRGARDLMMILLSISYFIYLIQTLPEEDLLRFPMFWINSAILIFFSGTFILSYLMDYITTIMRDQFAYFWAFRNFFRFAFCLVLSYAGWLNLQSVRAAQKSALLH
ncbi:MAG: hypothetical protein KF845_01750 [Cyclobacteriaceae bacterium]|nr:hypothetical protein [Cyclobacteriaceae bacterium]